MLGGGGGGVPGSGPGPTDRRSNPTWEGQPENIS